MEVSYYFKKNRLRSITASEIITVTSQQLYLKFGATLRRVTLLGLTETRRLVDGWFQEARFCQATPESNCCLLC